MYDLILKGGSLVDPSRSLSGVHDIAIEQGMISSTVVIEKVKISTQKCYVRMIEDGHDLWQYTIIIPVLEGVGWGSLVLFKNAVEG